VDAVEQKLKASRPHLRSELLWTSDIETNFLGKLTARRMLRGLARIDATTWGVPHRWPRSLRVSASEQQHPRFGVNDDHTR
jgi:hypothetical protein